MMVDAPLRDEPRRMRRNHGKRAGTRALVAAAVLLACSAAVFVLFVAAAEGPSAVVAAPAPGGVASPGAKGSSGGNGASGGASGAGKKRKGKKGSKKRRKRRPKQADDVDEAAGSDAPAPGMAEVDVDAAGEASLDALFGDDEVGGAGAGVDVQGGEEQGDSGSRHSATTRSFQLEHSIGGAFVPRGALELRVNQLSGKTVGKFVGSGHGLSSEEDAAAFRDLVANDGFYRLRARSDPDDPASPFAVTSIRACLLARLKFKERIQLHVDGAGKLQSMEYHAPPSLGTVECRTKDAEGIAAGSSFSPSAKVVAADIVNGIPERAVGGMQVPKAAGAPPTPAPTTGEGEKPTEQQGSFFSRYMWIIIPVVAIMALSGGGDPGQGQGGGRPGGAGGATASAGASAAR